MSTSSKRQNAESDQQKSATPDAYRNDDAHGKDHDQPDSNRERNKADPEHDYPRPDGSE